MSVRFLHTADIHIGLNVTRFSPDCAQRIRAARQRCLENIVRIGNDHAVDFVLICGDLFDDNNIDAAESARAFEVISTSRAPVYVLPGNHDPLMPGAVWHRGPWADSRAGTVRVLRDRTPIAVSGSAVLYPCPCVSQRSVDDPTAWIPAVPAAETAGTIRIGAAHGSLNDGRTLPEDDHVISPQVPVTAGLDYLALGHWHHRYEFKQPQSTGRIVYPGTPEAMTFGDSSVTASGWLPYSRADSALFGDKAAGFAALVSIDWPGAVPEVESVATGNLRWVTVSHELPRPVADLSAQLLALPDPDRTLVTVLLTGVASAAAMVEVAALEALLTGRFLHIAMDRSQVLLAPTAEEFESLAEDGLTRIVIQKLLREAAGDDEGAANRARNALLVAYRMLSEVRSC